jgi:hypothetical protein
MIKMPPPARREGCQAGKFCFVKRATKAWFAASQTSPMIKLIAKQTATQNEKPVWAAAAILRWLCIGD